MNLFHLEHRAARHKLAMPRLFAGPHNEYASGSISQRKISLGEFCIEQGQCDIRSKFMVVTFDDEERGIVGSMTFVIHHQRLTDITEAD